MVLTTFALSEFFGSSLVTGANDFLFFFLHTEADVDKTLPIDEKKIINFV